MLERLRVHTALPVKPWNMTRVSLSIRRLDIVLSYGDVCLGGDDVKLAV